MSRQTLTRVRWPLAPLLVAAGHPPVTVLAARLSVATRTVARWRHNGLTDDQADQAAIMLGYHPLNVWTDDDGNNRELRSDRQPGQLPR